jgi:hypothetical protein
MRERAQLRSASSIGLRPGRVSSMATDPPAAFRPTMRPHNSSKEPHIVGSAQRGMSSIWVSCGLILPSGSRKPSQSRGRPNPSGPIKARQRRQRSSELRIAGIACGRPRVGISVMAQPCRDTQRPCIRRNALSPESVDTRSTSGVRQGRRTQDAARSSL